VPKKLFTIALQHGSRSIRHQRWFVE